MHIDQREKKIGRSFYKFIMFLKLTEYNYCNHVLKYKLKLNVTHTCSDSVLQISVQGH